MGKVNIKNRKFDLEMEGRVAIVVADWNSEVGEGLLGGALSVFEEYQNVKIDVFHVTGAFEIPLFCQKLVRHGSLPDTRNTLRHDLRKSTESENAKFDVIIALGCVLKGETYHFELIANECARGCMDVMLREDVPIVFSVLAAYRLEDAVKRSNGMGSHGELAAKAALEWVKLLNC